MTVHLDRNLGVALDYFFRQNLVLKLEGHQDRGLPRPRPTTWTSSPYPEVKIRYGILTLSVSF